jgi:phosphoribosylformylglycinamidine cyclo-ligase
MAEAGIGLAEGARQANISIPGGEISQVPEIIRAGERGFGFDLAGTCVGIVDKERILTGAGTEQGDVIIGIASSGIHSNGLTLARDVLFHQAGYEPMQVVEELGRPVGEELLEPTRIYVKPVLRMLEERLAVKALAHITGDGLLNLLRADTDVSYVIDALPETPAIFELIQRVGKVEAAEMFRVYNMGVGFCVVCAPTAAERIQELIREHGWESWRIGYVEADGKREVRVPEHGLVGRGETFSHG